MSTSSTPLFLYDGKCRFCTRAAVFIMRHIPGPARIEAWQLVDLATLPVSRADCESAVQWIEYRPDGSVHVSSAAAAIADLLRSSTRLYWRLAGAVLGLSPVLLVAEPVYRFIARNRGKIPGVTPTCELTESERAQLGR